MSNREWWLIPWSVGWECRTKKPDSGDAIHVIEKAYADALKASCDELIKTLYDISIYPKGVPPDQPQPSKIEYAMADLAEAAMAQYEEQMERLK